MSANQHDLSCPHCQTSIAVTTRQAGQEVTCDSCEKSVTAPRLGKLKQLPLLAPAEGDPSTAKSSAGTNLLFVIGLLLFALCGAGGGAVLYNANQMIVDYNVDGGMDRMDPYVDELTPAQVAVLFDQMNVDAGLGDWREQPHVASTKQGRILQKFSYALLTVSGIGLIIMLVALLRR